MKFEELLKKYKDGTATAEECTAVEEELEKVRLIEEYLAEEETVLPLPEVNSAVEVKAVQRTITRRTRGTALAVVASVLALLALLQFLLLPWANGRIYDEPDYNSSDFLPSSYDILMDTISRLYLPGYRYLGSSVEKSTGFGRWTLIHSLYGPDDIYLPEFTLTSGILNVDSREFWELFPAVNLMDIYSTESAVSVLERMDESIRVTAAVRFSETMDFDEIVAFRQTWDEGSAWSSLHVSAAVLSNQTFRPLFLSFEDMSIGWDETMNGRGYPSLWINTSKADADTFRQHLASRLQYLIDNERLVRKFDPHQNYRGLLDELQNDQVTFDGVWVCGTPSQLLELCACEDVQGVWLLDAFVSLY